VTKRALALLAPAVLTLGLVACSDDDDSADTTTATTTVATTDTTIESETDATTEDGASDAPGSAGSLDSGALGQIFPALDDEQLDCLAERISDVTEAMDPRQAQAIAEDCDIDPADLTPDMSAISLPDLSDVSIPENMDEMMQQVFPGLSDEQVTCLVEQLGADFDIAKAQQLTETCNIDPADLTPG
jgi:hypothetical protein